MYLHILFNLCVHVNLFMMDKHVHTYTLEAVRGKSAVDTLQLIAMYVCAINTHMYISIG